MEILGGIFHNHCFLVCFSMLFFSEKTRSPGMSGLDDEMFSGNCNPFSIFHTNGSTHNLESHKNVKRSQNQSKLTNKKKSNSSTSCIHFTILINLFIEIHSSSI